jgi:hypothetical protein
MQTGASADTLLFELEFLRRSGVDEGSATFRGHMDAFLKSAAQQLAQDEAGPEDHFADASAAAQQPRRPAAVADGSSSSCDEAAVEECANERTVTAALLRQRVVRGRSPGHAAGRAYEGTVGTVASAIAATATSTAGRSVGAGGGQCGPSESRTTAAAAATSDACSDSDGDEDRAATDGDCQPPEFYDAAMDDDDEAWVARTLRGEPAATESTAVEGGWHPSASAPPAGPDRHSAAIPGAVPPAAASSSRSSGTVLSCPYCFSPVAYDAQQHATHEGQFRASHAAHINVRADAPLAAAGLRNNRANAAAAVAVPGVTLLPVECGTCGTQLGVLERPSAASSVAGRPEVYHFFHVLPGTG